VYDPESSPACEAQVTEGRLVSERRRRGVLRASAAPYDKDLIAFVGRMDYFPNRQAA
jgi:hypothetical protein